jgi:hypothetical protein
MHVCLSHVTPSGPAAIQVSLTSTPSRTVRQLGRADIGHDADNKIVR